MTNNMDNQLSTFSGDLKIDPSLLLKGDGKSVTALVTNHWLNNFRNNDEHHFLKKPEDCTGIQIRALLNHSCSFDDNKFIKVSISVHKAKLLQKILFENSSETNSQDCPFRKLCEKNFSFTWKKALLEYANAYHSYSVNCANKEKCQIPSNVDICHVHLIPVIASTVIHETCYLVQPYISHSIQDALLYSPAMLTKSGTRLLFIVYQLLQVMNFLSKYFPLLGLRSVSWRDAQLDDMFWMKINVFNSESYISSTNSEMEPVNCTSENGKTLLPTEELNCCDQFNACGIDNTVDKWVSGQMSNFDYLMFLNNLAGRKIDDPFHHPILPWVSDLTDLDSGWRDLSKSKYRLNKGDDQLNLQYAMAVNEKTTMTAVHLHAPHHVPDMLSDITFYVYLARRIPQEILQKHVRSYWEPNEYPATIQRMQAWSPDECIPQFYTDSSVFSSIHEDMTDLGVPDWCTGPQDFVEKHMQMLESERVSSNLHKWIDVTFGYKLSGKPAVKELNVCRQLADQHQTPSTHGIVQLFFSPHPEKRIPSCIPLPRLIDHHLKSNSLLELETSDKLNAAQTGSANETEDNGKSNGSKTVNAKRKIKLPDDYDPFTDLDQLEKLMALKFSITNKASLSVSLQNAITGDLKCITATTIEDVVSDHNVLVFFCLTMELYSSQNLHVTFASQPLSSRFNAAARCFQNSKSSLPTGLCKVLSHIIECLNMPLSETCNILKQFEDLSMENKVDRKCLQRIFISESSKGFPPPSIEQFLQQELFLLPTPPYFKCLHCFLELLMTLTSDYSALLEESSYPVIEEKLVELLSELHNQSEGLSIVMPHLINMVESEVYQAVPFLVMFFDRVAQELGRKETVDWFLKPVIHLCNRINALCVETIVGNEADLCNAIEILYGKTFLVQLWNRFGFETFLDNLPRLLIECLIRLKKKMGPSYPLVKESGLPCITLIYITLPTLLLVSCYNVVHKEIIMDSLQWMMMRFGPTLTSKYIIRHLLHAANLCFCNEADIVAANHVQVIDCLVFAASMYGSSFFTVQYIPHISYTVSTAISGTRFTLRSFAALEASCTILIHLIPYFTNNTVAQQLRRLSKEIVMPLIGILASKRIRFPGGALQRKRLCLKTIKMIVKIAISIGRETSQQHLTELLQSLFCNFSSHLEIVNQDDNSGADAIQFEMDCDSTVNYLSPSEDSIFAKLQLEDKIKVPSNIAENSKNAVDSEEMRKERRKYAEAVLEEVRAAFCPECANQAYIPLARLMGGTHMEKILHDLHDHIWRLSTEHERAQSDAGFGSPSSGQFTASQSPTSKVKVVGNKIVVDKLNPFINPKIPEENRTHKDLNGNGFTHLKGNWLAYWEHEIGLADGDNHIHFNQIDLQKFVGHSAAVKYMHASDSEGWFMTASKDKTVRIWSLHGSTSDQVDPLFTYRQHRKTVSYCSLVPADNSAVSCDGSLHIWDPYTGQLIKCFDSSEFKPNGISSVLALPAPQRQVLVNTSDCLKMIDLRSQTQACEYKAAGGPNIGAIRSICSNGNWVAVGFTSGVISIVDLRMGPILRLWQAHDNDVISACTMTDKTFVTTSMDQTIAIWDTNSVTPRMVYRSVTEPVQMVKVFHDELLTASFSNRITVLPLPTNDDHVSSAARATLDKPITVTKLRSDCLKGSLTSFAVLAMKRQLIVASDTGAVKLLT